MVDALLSPDGQSAIVKAGSAEETREAIDEELEAARAELAQVKEEAAGMLDEARAQIEVMRRNAMEEASEQGFQEGYQKGMEEVREMERACQARRESGIAATTSIFYYTLITFADLRSMPNGSPQGGSRRKRGKPAENGGKT